MAEDRGRHFRSASTPGKGASRPAAGSASGSSPARHAAPSRAAGAAGGQPGATVVFPRLGKSAPSGRASLPKGASSAFASTQAGQTQTGQAQASSKGKKSSQQGSNSPKNKKGNISRIISNVLIAVGVVLLCIAAGLFLRAQYQYHEQDVENAKLAAFTVVTPDGSKPPAVDWAKLRKINKDAIGWIQIPGTVINYPVYQGKSNEQYLRTTAEGKWSIGGQIFMDYQNRGPGLNDEHTIIYGHHLYNGSMFKQVADFDKQGFFDSIKTIWYVTDKQAYELEPLFLYYTTGEDTTVRQFNFPSKDAFKQYLQERFKKAVTKRKDADKIIAAAPKVLALSTCNYLPGYGRTELFCVEKSVANQILKAEAK